MANIGLYTASMKFNRFLEEEELIQERATIDRILTESKNKPGSLIPVLQGVQKIIKYLPPVVQDYIAHGLNIPSSDVYGVVSFYSFFTMVPRGDHIIRVCLGTACYVKGGNLIAKNLQKELRISEGETTEDRKFTFEIVRCLGACGLAPVVVIDDVTYGQCESKKTIEIIGTLASSSD